MSTKAFEALLQVLEDVCKTPDDRPLVIPSGLGFLIEKVFKVLPSTDGRSPSVPVSIVINMKTGRPSDLHYGEGITEVWIENLLNDHCLRNVSATESGSYALRFLLDLIRRELLASLAAEKNVLWQHLVAPHDITAWNDLVELRDHWDLASLKRIYNKLEDVGLFKLDVIDGRSCLPRTSHTNHNPDMSQRFWVTDTCFGAILQRKRNPEGWKKALVTISAFHLNHQNLQAVKNSIADPNWYRFGDWRNGVAHIFLLHDIHGGSEGVRYVDGVPVPDSLREDPAWGNRKRLESQALTLLRIVETIIAGAVTDHHNPEIRALGREWGINWLRLDQPSKDILLSAVKVLSSYLLAVEWNGAFYDMKAPTVSSWEEVPLPEGCTSDLGFMVDAFRRLEKLLFEERFNDIAAICQFREDAFSETPSYEGEEFYSFINRHPYADYRRPENLSAFITAGELVIAERVTSPAAEVFDGICRSAAKELSQNPTRHIDSSLTLLGYHSSFDENPARHANALAVVIRDVYRGLGPSRRDRALGMRRYQIGKAEQDGKLYTVFDSYLGLRFNLGLFAPALVKHQFAAMVSVEWSKISPFIEKRRAKGTISPRDEVVKVAFERFVAPNGNSVIMAKKDATTPEALSWRQQFQLPDWSACWTIGPSASLIALGRAKISLLKRVLEVGWSEVLVTLYFEIQRLLDEITNLCLKTIVKKTDVNGNLILRADGTELPNEYNVVEAFQAVLTPSGKVVFRPGDHTLMWSMVQTEKGLRLAIQAAKLEERVLDEMGEPNNF